MMRTRISGEITVSQGRTVRDSNLHSWKTNGHRRNSEPVLPAHERSQGDGATRAYAVTNAI